ncbi:NnrS family protein [Azospirillum sp. TSO35-2]|uniref:NnrS family protein n=1 Tax=Azospirillum sp. TSO35-2 TaxID=716796 RepID=UPI000D649D86|nr:NnrS family protein [Azospirillum sp. TSO35-2]
MSVSPAVTSGHRLMYPAAALYGALMVPLWVAQFSGLLPLGWTAAVHAHEMVGGYALAVVGGFLMTRLSRATLALAALSWLAGRLAMLAGLPPVVALPASFAYPLLLFIVAGVPFLRGARSGHNAVFGPLIAAFILSEALFWAAELGITGGGGAPFGLALVGTLLMTMGGRVIPAATAGALRSQGLTLVQRVQPRLEWIGIAGAAVALLSAASGLYPEVGAVGAILAGVSALARLARWRTAAILRHPEIASLHLGYLCVGAGWVLAGGGTLLDLPGAAAWHLLAVGGLGILANAMMLRTALQREAEAVRFPLPATVAVGMLAGAALLRVAALWWPAMPPLVGAAVLWTLGHLLMAAVLLTRRRRSPRRLSESDRAESDRGRHRNGPSPVS